MRTLETVMTESMVESLEQGMFSTKYKIFCRGISSNEQLTADIDFADDFRNRNGFFLVVDGLDPAHLRLSPYLNTGVISRATGVIFEKIFVSTASISARCCRGTNAAITSCE